jgi:hypothetical protein
MKGKAFASFQKKTSGKEEFSVRVKSEVISDSRVSGFGMSTSVLC